MKKEQICYPWTAYLHSRKFEWFVLHHIQVIDEIDGIMGGTEGKGAVDALVEMVGLKTLPSDQSNALAYVSPAAMECMYIQLSLSIQHSDSESLSNGHVSLLGPLMFRSMLKRTCHNKRRMKQRMGSSERAQRKRDIQLFIGCRGL
jgi:hypothetical protein